LGLGVHWSGGFDINQSDYTVASGNSATDNLFGIVAFRSDHITLTDNRANSNTGVGFELAFVDDSSLRGNRANRNADLGFGFRESNRNTVDGNRAFHNVNEFGFQIGLNSADNVFTSNHACRNGLYDAIEFDSAGTNTYNENKFCTSAGL
jgi:parallel beta-helix repeat protein